ncbi:hypothetical protein ANSO36C_67700 (plasmid) [Nostoc cf. commune SO-36]|uniref:Ig-like domain-containing protein n=1 Tax=Nostoc cf. commune SO-36 TaxID=449208 RepID=A0ABM7ZCE6_NOSCO|nr:hypothetical protein [Nostoc commune]BDI20968.1 hypothetical protein ANSO36C_67700 [Nostoc cf. commune SO-36]
MILEWPTPTVTEDFYKNDCQWREITEETYDWFLECVPPLRQNGSYFLNGEPYTHLRNGEGVYLGCKEESGRYYCRLMTVKQYDERKF